MAENRVIIEGMFPGLTYEGSTVNPLPVLLSTNPQIDGSYTASIANVVGSVASNNLMTIFNPVGSGKTVIIGAVFISTVAAAGTASTVPARIHRIGAAPTGGVTMASGDIFKLNTANPNAVCVIQHTNPSVTLLAAGSNTPPPVTTGVGGGQFVHEIEPPPGAAFTLAAGEGIAVNVASGDSAQRWNLTIAWAEI